VGGDTAIETSVVWTTFTTACPAFPDRVAVTVVEPAFTPVTWPAVVAELPTVAIVLSATDQLANVVTSSENWVAGSPAVP